jgi:hypothetical protein
MSVKETLLFSFPKHAHDMRMLTDRVLEPDTAHPLIRDLLESLRSCRYGEAQFLIHSLKRVLGLNPSDMQNELAALLFANATHSPSPFIGFQYLLDSGFFAEPIATEIMEHIALGQYFSGRDHSLALLDWFQNKGGMIVPESKAAWKALESQFPEAYAKNNSHYESQKLESYIRSQSLEVREVSRL